MIQRIFLGLEPPDSDIVLDEAKLHIFAGIIFWFAGLPRFFVQTSVFLLWHRFLMFFVNFGRHQNFHSWTKTWTNNPTFVCISPVLFVVANSVHGESEKERPRQYNSGNRRNLLVNHRVQMFSAWPFFWDVHFQTKPYAGWWFGTGLEHHIGNVVTVVTPTDELYFSKGVKPPTRYPLVI